MQKAEITRRAWAELEAPLAEMGYEVIEIEFLQEGRRMILRLFVDKTGGITLDDCTAVTQLVSPLLDRSDFVSGEYFLEVSSPGIDRPVRKPADFERFVGEPIRVRAVEPVQGRRNFRGVLQGFDDGLIVVACDGQAYSVHIENLAKANLDR